MAFITTYTYSITDTRGGCPGNVGETVQIPLYDVARSTTVGMMLYCSPVWWGFAAEQERGVRRLVSVGYLALSSH